MFKSRKYSINSENLPQRSTRESSRPALRDLSNHAPGRSDAAHIAKKPSSSRPSVSGVVRRASAVHRSLRNAPPPSRPVASTRSSRSSAPAAAAAAPAGAGVGAVFHAPTADTSAVSKIPAGVVHGAEDIDASHRSRPLEVVDYVNDMYTHYRNVEATFAPTPTYMSTQTSVNTKMRAILVDWLAETHLKFKLVPQVLYLSVSYLDRFLTTQVVSRSSLQLVGVTCLLVAAKFEEIFPPSLKDLVYVTDRSCSKQQIIRMETQILQALQYRLASPTVFVFLARYLKASRATTQQKHTANYVAERMLQEYSMLKYLPSTLAAAAVMLARRTAGLPEWTPTLQQYSRYSEEHLAECVAEMESAMRAAATVSSSSSSSSSSNLTAVKKKFSSSKFGMVATTTTF